MLEVVPPINTSAGLVAGTESLVGSSAADSPVAGMAAELVIARTVQNIGSHAGQNVIYYDFAHRRLRDGALNDLGDGEGGPERPNRALLVEAVHGLADGPFGRQMYASDRLPLAREAAAYLHDDSWLPSDADPDGPVIGKIARVPVELDDHIILVEASYLDVDTQKLVDALANFDDPLSDPVLDIWIYPKNTKDLNDESEVVRKLEIYVDFPKDAPATWLLEALPATRNYDQVMRRILKELGFDDELKDRALTGRYFAMPDQEEPLLRRLNVFLRRHVGQDFAQPGAE